MEGGGPPQCYNEINKLSAFYWIRGKAKRKIHVRYPFLGGSTYQPPVLSVSYLQVGY